MYTPPSSRFIRITPKILHPDYGTEPNLFKIIMYYYTSHGINTEEALKITNKYITEWEKKTKEEELKELRETIRSLEKDVQHLLDKRDELQRENDTLKKLYKPYKRST